MTWTEEEIRRYRNCREQRLGSFYASAGLGIEEPEKRAEYLAEKLNLTPTDHDVVMRASLKEGKAEGLRMLEQMAIAVFF